MMADDKMIWIFSILIGAVFIFAMIGTVFGEEYEITLSNEGATDNYLRLNSTDTLRFISSDSFNWIIENSKTGGAYQIDNILGDTPQLFCGENFFTQHENYDDVIYDTPITIMYDCPPPPVIEIVAEPMKPEQKLLDVKQGWYQEGDRMIHYNEGIKTTSYAVEDRSDIIVYRVVDGELIGYKNGLPLPDREETIPLPTASTSTTTPESNPDLDLRLRILQVLENIFRILFD